MTHKRILVTSALPYVNNVPHLGNLICIISADIYARFAKSAGHEVLSILGTDEHGTTSELVALKENKTPKVVCDEYYAIHKEIYEWFNTDFSCLGRSSSTENAKVTQDVFNKLEKNGFICEKTVSQFYDTEKKQFLADRFITGTCPKCGFEDARGDQCDSCQSLFDQSELKNPKSTISESVPELRESTHLYIDLPKLKPDLDAFFAERKSKWSKNAQSITKSWLDNDLRARAITRDLKWGIPVPGQRDKVFYSWFDAPIAYIGITAECGEDVDKWWHNDTEVRLVQFMGKDNTQFHTVLFPAFLLGTRNTYTLLDSISVNEYLNYEGTKFSKSRGTGVFGTDAKKTGISADAYRYYLTAIRPESEDTNFSWEDFAAKVNKELIGNYANLVNRLISFTNRFFDGKVPELTSKEIDLTSEFTHITNLYEQIALKDALKATMSVSKTLNGYFQEKEPWQLIKEDKDAAGNVIANLFNAVNDVTIALAPIIPVIAQDAFAQLNSKRQLFSQLGESFETGHPLAAEKPLLTRIDVDQVKELQLQFGGEQEEFPIELKVAQITSIEPHPDADKLYIEKLDLGNGETRQIVSGLKDFYTPEELVGKKIILVSNLKPAKLRGVLSEGMLLAGEDSTGAVKVLEVKTSKVGELVTFGNRKVNTEEITYDQFSKVKMKVQNGAVLLGKTKLSAPKEVVSVDLGQGIVR